MLDIANPKEKNATLNGEISPQAAVASGGLSRECEYYPNSSENPNPNPNPNPSTAQPATLGRRLTVLDSPVAWRDEYCIGIPVIDIQHQRLFAMVEDLRLAVSGGHRQATVAKVLKGMVSYCSEHFDCEEMVMQLVKYPGYRSHCEVHSQLTESTLAWLREYEAGRLAPVVVLDTLLKWLKNHIQDNDLHISEYCVSKNIDCGAFTTVSGLVTAMEHEHLSSSSSCPHIPAEMGLVLLITPVFVFLLWVAFWKGSSSSSDVAATSRLSYILGGVGVILVAWAYAVAVVFVRRQLRARTRGLRLDHARQLASNMLAAEIAQRVAVMDLEGIDALFEGEDSALVRGMQEVVEHLRAYLPYIPTTVLALARGEGQQEQDGDDEEDGDNNGSVDRGSRTVSHPNRVQPPPTTSSQSPTFLPIKPGPPSGKSRSVDSLSSEASGGVPPPSQSPLPLTLPRRGVVAVTTTTTTAVTTTITTTTTTTTTTTPSAAVATARSDGSGSSGSSSSRSGGGGGVPSSPNTPNTPAAVPRLVPKHNDFGAWVDDNNNDDDNNNENDDDPTSAGGRRRSLKALIQKKMPILRFVTAGALLKAKALLDRWLTHKHVTLVAADLTGLLGSSGSNSGSVATLLEVHTRFVRVLEDACKATKGTVLRVAGTRVLLAWNAATSCGNHAQLACRAALQIRDSVEAQREAFSGVSVRLAVSSGGALVGTMGTPSHLSFTVVGPVVTLAHALAQLNPFLGTTVLICSNVWRDVKEFYVAKIVALLESTPSARPLGPFSTAAPAAPAAVPLMRVGTLGGLSGSGGGHEFQVRQPPPLPPTRVPTTLEPVCVPSSSTSDLEPVPSELLAVQAATHASSAGTSASVPAMVTFDDSVGGGSSTSILPRQPLLFKDLSQSSLRRSTISTTSTALSSSSSFSFGSGHQGLYALELTQARASNGGGDGEWMYVLQDASGRDPYAALNSAMAHVFFGAQERGVAMLKDYLKDHSEDWVVSSLVQAYECRLHLRREQLDELDPAAAARVNLAWSFGWVSP